MHWKINVCIFITKNRVSNEYKNALDILNNIQMRHFFIRVRALVEEQQIKVNHVPAEFQLAYCKTKPLNKPKLMTLWQAM